MARQTDRALAERAVQAANLMQYLIERISEEMDKQNIKPSDRASPVTLSANFLITRISDMQSLIEEIRALDGHRVRETVRGRGYPSSK